MKPVIIYTDGACIGNPGPGGWAAIVLTGAARDTLAGGEPGTTNNRMEMTAAIRALESLPEPAPVELHTDSTYLKDGITKWIHGWKRNGWRTASRRPVKNRDLWEELDSLARRHRVTWHWVRGHEGDPLNEECDRLANREAARWG